jgi:hypothetical protein
MTNASFWAVGVRPKKLFCFKKRKMLVEDTTTLAVKIAEYFQNNYTPSNPIAVSSTSGWPVSEQGDDAGTRRFSNDFLEISLPKVLKRCADVRISNEKMHLFLPENIFDLTAQFILEYDEIHGYNGVMMDLKRAESQFSYQLGYSIKSHEMEVRRSVVNPPKEGMEQEWYSQVNAYTRLARPKFDHFSQEDDDEYLRKFDPDTPYARGRIGMQRHSAADASHTNMSEYAQSYLMHPSFRATTTNTVE